MVAASAVSIAGLRSPASSLLAAWPMYARSEGVTALMATHDPLILDLADRVVVLRDGRIVDDA